MTRVYMMMMLAMGCGGGAIEVQARAAKAASSIIVDLGDSAKQSRIAAQKKAVDELRAEALEHDREEPYREDALDAVAAVRKHWEPIVAGYNALVDAHRTWVDWLLVYIDKGEVDAAKIRYLISRVLETWAAFKHAASTVDLTIPAPPDILIKLVEGGDG